MDNALTISDRTADCTKTALAESGLNARQEAFCRLYAECGIAGEAYEAIYMPPGGRAVARPAAYRLLRNPKVAARVRELQEVATERSLRSTASLIRDLESMVEADSTEIVRLDVGGCRHCWGTGGGYQWRDDQEIAAAFERWLASQGSPKPLPSLDLTGGIGYLADRDPNPECRACDGAGVQRVKFTSTADVSPGARRLLRGIELFPDGSVKRVILHDQLAARTELHRLRGLHIDRSVTLHAHANVKPLPANLSVEDALRMLETISPAPADDAAAPDDPTVVSDQ